MDAAFWIALAGIVWVDLLLSGDNALVIAMVCRQLPRCQQMMGTILGASAAVGLRIFFAIFVSELISIPGLGICGAALLLYVAVNLAASSDGGGKDHRPTATLLGAVLTIAIADASMSLDNVIAIAALSGGRWLLLALGVALSIPIVIAGSAIIASVIDRFPIMKWAGAGILGWVAGGILAKDAFVQTNIATFDLEMIHLILSVTGMAIVIIAGIITGAIRQDAKPVA